MRVWTKNTICWKFWENFHKIIAKNALYLHTFQNKINKPCVNFLLTFGPKTQLIGKFWENFESFNENFIEKWKFYFIFRKFVTKNRAFGSNTIFLQQFFRFRGGGISPFPLATPLPLVDFDFPLPSLATPWPFWYIFINFQIWNL